MSQVQEVEEKFIAILMKNKDLASDWIDKGPDKKFFHKDYHLLLEAIKYAFFNESKVTRTFFTSWLEAHCPDRKLIPPNEAVFARVVIKPVDRNLFPLLSEKIIDNHITVKTFEEYNDFRGLLKDGRAPKEAVKTLYDALGNIVDYQSDQKPTIYEGVDTYADDWMKEIEYEKNNPQKLFKIRTQLKAIDETMVVGINPGSMTLMCAEPGCFKTTMMLQIAINVWKSGHNVLFIPLEMPRNMLYKRFMSNIARVPFDEIANPENLTTEKMDKLKRGIDKVKSIDNQLFIMEKPSRVAPGHIQREVEKHVDIFKPALVVIDYIGIMVPDRKRDRADLEIGDTLKTLRSMGNPRALTEEGFGILSGAQVSREALKRIRRSGVDKIEFNSEDVKGGQVYLEDADNAYAMTHDMSQKGHVIHLHHMKTRYGKATFSNGNTTITMSVQPQYNVIEDINNDWLNTPTNMNELMSKTDDNLDDDIDFDDDLDFEEPKALENNNGETVVIEPPKVITDDPFDDLDSYDDRL